MYLFFSNSRLPRWLSGKESPANTGDMGSVPGLGKFPGAGNGNPLQSSYPENSMNKGAWQAAVHGLTESRHDWVPKHTGMQTYTCIFYYFLDHNTFLHVVGYYISQILNVFFSTIFTPRLSSLTKVYQEVSKNTFLASMTINYTCPSVAAVSTCADLTHHGLHVVLCFHIYRFNPPWIESNDHISFARLK